MKPIEESLPTGCIDCPKGWKTLIPAKLGKCATCMRLSLAGSAAGWLAFLIGQTGPFTQGIIFPLSVAFSLLWLSHLFAFVRHASPLHRARAQKESRPFIAAFLAEIGKSASTMLRISLTGGRSQAQPGNDHPFDRLARKIASPFPRRRMLQITIGAIGATFWPKVPLTGSDSNKFGCPGTCDIGGGPCDSDSDCPGECEIGGGICFDPLDCPGICDWDGSDASDGCPHVCEAGVDIGNQCSEASHCRGTCMGGFRNGKPCFKQSECPGICVGGPDDGASCFSSTDCPFGGFCKDPRKCGNEGVCNPTPSSPSSCYFGSCFIPFICEPTWVTLIAFEAVPIANQIVLTWRTGTEIDNAGFHIYRSLYPDKDFVRVNHHLIPAEPGAVVGMDYRFTDETAGEGAEYHYKLQSVDLQGQKVFTKPTVVKRP